MLGKTSSLNDSALVATRGFNLQSNEIAYQLKELRSNLNKAFFENVDPIMESLNERLIEDEQSFSLHSAISTLASLSLVVYDLLAGNL